MIRRLLVASALLTAVPTLPAAAAPAQRCDLKTLQGCDKSQLYVFGDQVFDTDVRRPAVRLFTGRAEVRHARMLSLKKDLLPRIAHNRAERALR